MNVCIRVDSSSVIGTGHVTRCLTLAEQFRKNGNSVLFICRELPGNVMNLILSNGFELNKLPAANYDKYNQNELNIHKNWLAVDWQVDLEQTGEIIKSLRKEIDLLVVDHYAIDKKWEDGISSHCYNIMLIDDLADRPHTCDFLLDQNYYKDLDYRYDNLVPKDCVKMPGPSYAMLRPEFFEARQTLRKPDGIIKNVMVFFGGADSSNQTGKVLDVISSGQFNNINFDIVLGGTNQFREKIENECKSSGNVTIHCQIDYMAQLMAQSDLSISGGGTTTWERCCLGLPSLTIALAENQVEVAKLSENAGFAKYLGYYTEVKAEDIFEALKDLIINPEKVLSMSQIGYNLVDGKGVSRVANTILKYINNKSNIKI